MPWADFAVSGRLPGRLSPAPCWVIRLGLVRSVGRASASAAGPGGLVEGPVVDGLPEMDLPLFRSPACGVPGVEADEVVADEGDGHEQGCGDESGLSEEAAVDAQPLVAGGADEAFDEGAPVERQCPARADSSSRLCRDRGAGPESWRPSADGVSQEFLLYLCSQT